MIKVLVTKESVREMKGVGKVSGKPYHMRMQDAHAFTVDQDGSVLEIPDKFTIVLEENQLPYQRGTYQLSPAALYVDFNGNLAVRPRLVPAAAK